MGHGSCSDHGHCYDTRRGIYHITFPVLLFFPSCRNKYIEKNYNTKHPNLYLFHNILFVQEKDPDYQDFVGIVILLVINSTISFIEENNAGNAAAALMARLAPKAKVDSSSHIMLHKPL